MKIVLIALVFATLASAQNYVEDRTYVVGGVATPQVDGLFNQSVKGRLGAFEWLQLSPIYRQAYGGLTCSPTSWLQIALGGGLEQAKSPARLGSYVWAGKGKVSGLLIFENGGSGKWYKTETNYQLFSKLGLGTYSERFKGVGPKLDITIPHTPLKVWFAPLVKSGKVESVIGVRYIL